MVLYTIFAIPGNGFKRSNTLVHFYHRIPRADVYTRMNFEWIYPLHGFKHLRFQAWLEDLLTMVSSITLDSASFSLHTMAIQRA